jgi:hemin uptake protein HemP
MNCQTTDFDEAILLETPNPVLPSRQENAGRRGAAAPSSPLEYQSGMLFSGSREILIRHGDAVYRLKITKQGKLILNK